MQGVLPPALVSIGLRIAELHDAVNCSYERNSNGERWCRRTCPFGRPEERRRELAAAGLQAEFYLERERNARSAAPGVAQLLFVPDKLTPTSSKNHCSKD